MKLQRGILTVVGCGPGGREYLTNQAEKAVAQAELLCGPGFLLGLFPEAAAGRLVVRADAGQVVSLLRPRLEVYRTVLLVTGDPGLYSLAAPVTRLLGQERVCLLPGISALQLGFARLACSWEDVQVFSLHGAGREEAKDVLRQAAKSPAAAVFCSPTWTPQKVLSAVAVTAAGRTAHVLSNLGRPGEYRVSGAAAELARRVECGGRSLVILREEES